ncbi:MAG TPA: gamma-glutamylcyclotransferase family protein [Burkholderiaceae bacterium]|nr:gamma-glutamylcyclotransferase family protein [Burkholderiaceae bacterium]
MSDTTPPRTIDVFFYGLYMDEAVLAAKGVKAREPRPAMVEGFGLLIGQRATLVPRDGACAYGMVFALTHEEIEALYGELPAYRPEAVSARLLAGRAVPALCMNLSDPPAATERNPEYAAKLRAVLERLAFPTDYVSAVT